MHTIELHWLAGLLEGEGSFMQGPPSDPHKPIISIEMTDKDVVARVSSLFGTKVLTPVKRGQYKQTYVCRVRGARAVALMQQLYPLMGIRRQRQIGKALSTASTARRIVSTQDVDLMISLVREGFSHAEIADKLSLRRETVTRHLCKRYGGCSVAALHA